MRLFKPTPSQLVAKELGKWLKEEMEENKNMRMGNYEVKHNSENGATEFYYKPTIKIIDLLNKLANGEKMPKKIKYCGYIRKYDNEDKDYINKTSGGTDLYLFYDVLTSGSGNSFIEALNDEVEIIEDPKEDKIVEWSNLSINEMKKVKKISDLKEYIEAIIRTQNEIIEKLKTLD